MFPSNFKRHQSTCVYKVEIGATKAQILRALQNQPQIAVEPERNDLVDLAFIEMKNFLTDFFNKSRVLHRKVVENDLTDPIDRIKQMHVNNSTKDGYLVEFRLYKKWLKKNKKSIDADSANSYLSSSKCKPSTLKKKQMILQNLLKVIIDRQIKLNPVRMKISYQPKYSLSDQEIKKYLDEQRSNPEMYLIQKLMITYGLRVNTPAGLKVKDLTFLSQENQEIMLPDTKVNNKRTEEIDEEFSEEFREFLEGENLEDEDFVFYQLGKREEVRKRASALCTLVNKRIRDSKVIKPNANFKYTSHMFRKTKANNLFQEGLRDLKEKSRKAIGQAKNSTAIEHYIN